jgi:hypothetical protein
MFLLASAWFHGNWKAETANEREMQEILERNGFWPIRDSAALMELMPCEEERASTNVWTCKVCGHAWDQPDGVTPTGCPNGAAHYASTVDNEPVPEHGGPAATLVLYNELLYTVGKKYPGETRHQTALRYLRRAEEQRPEDSVASQVGPPKKHIEE